MKDIKIEQDVDPSTMDPFTRRNWDRVKQKTDQWKDGFSRLEQRVNRRFPEDRFRIFFLPLMLGKLNQEDFKAAFNEWLRIAGNEWCEVDLVNRAGAVVATVPAFNDMNRFSPPVEDRTRLPDKVAYADNMNKVNPNVARAMFSDVLLGALGSLYDKEAFSVCQQKWAKMFAYFGYHFSENGEIGALSPEGEVLKINNKPSSAVDDDIEVEW
jgi:hypothetical protein